MLYARTFFFFFHRWLVQCAWGGICTLGVVRGGLEKVQNRLAKLPGDFADGISCRWVDLLCLVVMGVVNAHPLFFGVVFCPRLGTFLVVSSPFRDFIVPIAT